jgi:hypothetical protein
MIIPKQTELSVGEIGPEPCLIPIAKAIGMSLACFGREHGRNKGEFNEFDGR